MKKWQKLTLEIIALVVGLVLINWLGTGDTIWERIIEAAWFVFLMVSSGYTNKRRTKQLQRMWLLADRLGYGPEELKFHAPQYGTLDWQFSRPDNLRFFPSEAVVKKLIKQFEAELANTEHLAS